MTTPYGSVSDSSDERLYGTWGVFSFGGVPMLFLWSQKGDKRIPLAPGGRDVTALNLAGGIFSLNAMKPGGCPPTSKR